MRKSSVGVENGIDGLKSVIAVLEAEITFMSKLKDASLASDVNRLLLEYSESVKINLDKYNMFPLIQHLNQSKS